ncbi:alpha/beta hydrolase fold [Austwickia chelonae]|uniref:Peptidase S33 tripeptidyl aminopeptidase-like C-terminal domain-containing protein n=1 Tax=Austwickia chelonae NBRC 105200 TaxID=1184607 RepID=K6V6B7_9MICO|nr:alpha/beta hydrolase [Austwickia chelonae]GAB77778.1 hypothetical protein AUCHE_08_00170 [Austwickia chelonae NBRC 105200]SEV89305.1 alpha/beta hydrolase fold [Austwickia chelonae]
MDHISSSPRRRAPHLVRAAALATALTLSTAGCIPASLLTTMSSEGTARGKQHTTQNPPTGSENLAKFYSQSLSWEKCDNLQCGWIEVPIDYSDPLGETLKLRVRKAPATGSARGTLFASNGINSITGLKFLKEVDSNVTPEVRKAYDIVEIDHRGTGQSNPIICLDDADMDFRYGSDPTPETEEEARIGNDIYAKFAQTCKNKYPKVLPHVSALDAAKDMDIARAVMGEKQLNYLGLDYGTYLGTIYADLFPTYVGRFVFDLAIPPDLTNKEIILATAAAREKNTQDYARHCITQGNCPLGSSPAAVSAQLKNFVTLREKEPLPVRNDPRVKELTEGWALIAVFAGILSSERWNPLTEAIRAAQQGDGTSLFQIAAAWVGRKDGRYPSGDDQTAHAVECLNRDSPMPSEDEQTAGEKELMQASPTWENTFSMIPVCEGWLVPPKLTPKRVTASGSNPILIVGSPQNPIFPYAWSERLAQQLDHSRHIRHEGHVSSGYPKKNTCVDRTVDDYLLNSKAPEQRQTSC